MGRSTRYLVGALVFTTLASFVWQSESAGEGIQDDHAAIEAVLTDLARSQDERDADRLLGALHAESKQFVQLPNGLATFDRERQAAGLRAGQIGGDDRAMTIHSIDVTGNAAMAKLELVGRLSFVHYVGLMQVEGRWQVMSVVTSVSGF